MERRPERSRRVEMSTSTLRLRSGRRYALLPKYPNRLGGCYTLATLSLGQLEAKAIDYYKQSLVITKEIRDVNLQALE